MKPLQTSEKLRHAVTPKEKNAPFSETQLKQPDIQKTAEVSDFMDGLDVARPSEKVAESAGEDQKTQTAGGGSTQIITDEETRLALEELGLVELPPQKVMIREIRQELQNEINRLLKQAKNEEKKGAYYLNEIMEKVRRLRGTLAELVTNTYEFIKKLYLSIFLKKKRDKLAS